MLLPYAIQSINYPSPISLCVAEILCLPKVYINVLGKNLYFSLRLFKGKVKLITN